jgi:hypothetical protein
MFEDSAETEARAEAIRGATSFLASACSAGQVGPQAQSEMKLEKARGKSGESPAAKESLAEAGLVGRLGSPAPEMGHAGVLI